MPTAGLYAYRPQQTPCPHFPSLSWPPTLHHNLPRTLILTQYTNLPKPTERNDKHRSRARKHRPKRSPITLHLGHPIGHTRRSMLRHRRRNGRRHRQPYGVSKLRDDVEHATGERLDVGREGIGDDEIRDAEQDLFVGGPSAWGGVGFFARGGV